jgi:hypothetical protein
MYIYMLVPRSPLLREHSGILRENNLLSESAAREYRLENVREPQETTIVGPNPEQFGIQFIQIHIN